ncbi:MAG: response regulator, partial [Verrucomicrobiaceae bacterium]
LTPEQRADAETIRTSAESLLTIINDILDFSKIEAGKLVFERLDFDLQETLESTLDILAASAQAKGLELVGFLDNHTPRKLRGDPARLRQILVNLIANAVKFTERGEVVVRVARDLETESHVVLRMEIRDTGIGIAPAKQERLFKAFTQVDGSTTRKYGGTGLGLAISKQLVELMHGEIHVQSEPGKGSTFWFTAQLEKQLLQTDVTPQPPSSIADLRLLIVDDNATNRKILRHQAEGWKMRNDGDVASGSEALEALRNAVAMSDPFAIALLDMQMPEMDGLTLARLIKADPSIAETKLVMLTSMGQHLDEATLKRYGLEAYLVKPVKSARLFDVLSNVAAGVPPRVTARQIVDLPSPRPLPAKTRILLAEDSSVNQMVALRQLRTLGYAADAVENGIEVLRALERNSYDIILMDCQMPELDGYEATHRIREKKLPVHIIAMTAHAMEGDRQKCLDAGMNDYVSKPVRIADLKEVLARWHAESGDTLEG